MNILYQYTFIKAVLLSSVLETVISQCHNHCSKRGRCTPEGRCECFDGFQGADCSERVCPHGSAFSDIAQSTDDAHNDLECSNRGLCDRKSGYCNCMEGFTGIACERTLCPNNCRGNGQCMSYSDYASNTLNSDSKAFEYISVWDAKKLYGCVCDFGYSGFDCSLKLCIRGDDPLTMGGEQETQLLKCTAESGSFVLIFEGRHSKQILSSADEHEVEEALTSIDGLDHISVTFSQGVNVCRSDVINIVSLNFTDNFGPLAPLTTLDIDLNTGATIEIGADPSTGQMIDDFSTTFIPVKGTKENIECSNRGFCDYLLGTCNCFEDLFAGSDGYGESGPRGDCGHPVEAIVTCPNDCSNQGVCDNATKTCSCQIGYTGIDCSLRICPLGPSWFSYPTGNNHGHDELVECSNMGYCRPKSGICECNNGFFGAACEYMGCGPNMTDPCSSNGICINMKQLASYFVNETGHPLPNTYGSIPNNPATWDADRIYGCICDEGFEGYDCSLRKCPLGDDPNDVENTLETCSNHGICDHTTGECVCLEGWGSSDGNGGPGIMRDCGYRLPITVLPRKGFNVIKRYNYLPN